MPAELTSPEVADQISSGTEKFSAGAHQAIDRFASAACRAAVRRSWLLPACVAAVVLLVTAWLVGVVAGMVWLLGSDASWSAALLLGAVLNIAAALLLVWRLRAP